MTKIILTLTVIIITFSGCVVSKKKYDALMLDRNKLSVNLDEKSAENRELKMNLEYAISDYETMKAEFDKSNALKSDEIADLMISVTDLQEKSDELNTKLNETLNKFKAEENASYVANEELESTLLIVSTLKRDTANLNRSLQMAKQRNKMLQDDLMESQEKLNECGLNRVEIQKEMDKQSAQIKEMELKLVKSQQNISEISKVFIDLRKELLNAKSNNKPVDPNRNNNIDKIAKLLGHY